MFIEQFKLLILFSFNESFIKFIDTSFKFYERNNI